ncbi:MAG: spore coat U domain-containing protein [Pseudomonadota bacterium]
MIRRAAQIIAVLIVAALFAATQAMAQTCTASVSNLNFGQVSVRAGAVNSTSGSVTVTCSGSVLSLVGVCIRFGPGGGGAGGGQSPRYMRRSDAAALSYELRAGGNGAPFGTLTDLYMTVPMVLGAGSATVPIFGDITSPTVGIGTGQYQSRFSGTADIRLSYGVVSCALLGTTVGVPDFTVSAEVVASCEVDATPMDFGTIPGQVTQPALAQATINVRCTQNSAYQVYLDNGSGPGATGPADRRLRNGVSQLSYGLFLDPGRSQVWGGTPGSGVAGTGAGTNQAIPVYGAIHAGQTAFIGIYTDSVIVTIAY